MCPPSCIMCTVWITGVICFGHIVSVIKTSLFGVPRLSANLLWPWPLGFRLGNTKLTIQVSPKSWVTDGAMKTLDCEVYSESNAAPKVQRAGQKKKTRLSGAKYNHNSWSTEQGWLRGILGPMDGYDDEPLQYGTHEYISTYSTRQNKHYKKCLKGILYSNIIIN